MRRYLYGFSLAIGACLISIQAQAAAIAGFEQSQEVANSGHYFGRLVTVMLLLSAIVISVLVDPIISRYRRWLVLRRLRRIIALERALNGRPCKPH